jgi:glycosyltransferase involved in cell wall biosynthesis
MGKAGLTVVQICHEFESRHFRWRWTSRVQMRLYRAVYRNFTAIFFLSEDTRRRFLESFPFPKERAFAIPHGNQDIFRALAKGDLSIRSRYGLNTEDKVILFFGSLSRTKGLPDLLAAYAQVRDHCRGTKLLVIGYPSKHIDTRDLQIAARTLGIADSTVFDFRYVPAEEVGALIEAATVMVFPYRTATQSGALQVAYSYGRPVVATSVGGLSEVVEEGRSGCLVPPRSPKSLAAAIERIISDPELADAMGKYARELADTKFAWPPIAARILSVYRELLGREPDLRRDDGTVSHVDPDRQIQA